MTIIPNLPSQARWVLPAGHVRSTFPASWS